MSPLAKRIYILELNLNNYAHYAQNEMGIDTEVLDECIEELSEIRNEIETQDSAKVPHDTP